MSKVKKVLIPIEQVAPRISRPQGVAWSAQIQCSSRVLANWFLYFPNREQTLVFFTLRRLKTGEAKKDPNYSHGIGMYKVNPEQKVFINLLPILITPAVYSGQWFCSKNELAIELVNETVDEICMGRMDPFSEEKDDWVMRFGDNIEGNEEDIKTSFVLSKEEIN